MIRTPISRRMTPRLRKSRAEFREIRPLVWERDGGLCVCCGLPAGLDWECHHRDPRGMGGSRSGDTHSFANLITLRKWCHRYWEQRRELARDLGYLVPMGIPVDEHSIFYLGRWSRLAHDGQVLDLEGTS